MIPLSPTDRAVSRHLHLHPQDAMRSPRDLAEIVGVTRLQAKRALIRLGHREPDLVRDWRVDVEGRTLTVGRLLDACEHLPGGVSCQEIMRDYPRRKGVQWSLTVIRDLRGYYEPHQPAPMPPSVWRTVDWTLCSRGISRILGVSVQSVQAQRRRREKKQARGAYAVAGV